MKLQTSVQPANHSHIRKEKAGDNGMPTGTTLVPELVGKVFEEAPMQLRRRLLEHLLKPLGLLSLVTVCNGAFAEIGMQSGWQRLIVRPQDAQAIQSREVIALVSYVEQVCVQAVDSLAQVLTASPVLASSAAAAMLLAALTRQAQSRSKPDARDFYVNLG